MSKNILSLFSKYTLIGVLNTAVHWLVFYIVLAFNSSQAIANVIGFLVAVSVSFVLNAKYNFASKMTPYKYVIYVAFLGSMAAGLGFVADKFALPSILTLLVFSVTSLVVGFLYSHFIVFRSRL